jgi:hypothetical protein
MNRNRRDPETGVVYAFGGLYDSGGSHDRERNEREDFERMLIRRADILAPKTTFAQQLARQRAIERELGWTGIPDVDFAAMLRRRSAELGLSTQRVSRPRTRSARPPVETRSPVRHDGRKMHRGMFVATESFGYTASDGGRARVVAGQTYARPEHEAVKLFPSRWAAAA